MILWSRFLSDLRRERVYTIGRLLLGVIFLLASIDKIRYPHLFGEIVYNYQVLSDMGVSLVAVLLPWVELTLGILLITGTWTPGAVLLANLMFSAFLALGIFNVARGLDVSCGCFSVRPTGDPAVLWTILRDVAFLALAVYLLLKTSRQLRQAR